MTCPKCGRSNPEDSRFCIYCANPLAASEEVTAATGPTVLLDATSVAPAAPTAPLPDSPIQPSVPANSGRKNQLTGAIWLIGLGILFLTKISFWPGILILVGLTSYIQEAARGRTQHALRSLIFFLGLTILFWTNRFFPGILILLGVMALISPEIRGRHA
jgi:hypothetical protein